MWPSDDTGGWRFIPEDPCGICGEETPAGAKHCSAKCASESARILEEAKGGSNA